MWQLTGHYLWHLTSNKNMQYAFSFHTFYRNMQTSQSKQLPSSHDSRFGYIFNGKSQPRTKSETLNYQFCSCSLTYTRKHMEAKQNFCQLHRYMSSMHQYTCSSECLNLPCTRCRLRLSLLAELNLPIQANGYLQN